MLRQRHAGVSADGSGGRPRAHRRRGFGWRRPPPARSRSGAGSWGFEGGAASLARSRCSTWCGLAHVPYGLPVRRANSSTGACSPGPSKSPCHYIQQAAFCPVNKGKSAHIPRGPATYRSPARLRQRTLQPPRRTAGTSGWPRSRSATAATAYSCKAWTPARTLQRSDWPAGVSARSQRDRARGRGFSYRERRALSWRSASR